MRRSLALLVAVAGLPLVSGAVVNTSVVWQVSLDYVNWSSTVDVNPSIDAQVYVRARVSYSGTASPLGLASMIFQPVVSNWDPTDTLLPFMNNADPDLSTQFGRVTPWGRSSLSSTSFLRGHVHMGGSGGAPPGTWLRIAQAQVTSWFGGAGNTSGGSGVPLAQLSNIGRTASDPAFNSVTSNIFVFKMGLVFHAGGPVRDLVIDSPTDGFGNRDSTTGERQVYWWADMNESTGSIRGAATVTTAAIHVIPGPGTLAAIGLCGISSVRRRMSRC